MFTFHPDDWVAVVIDGPNHSGACKLADKRVDFESLLEYLQEQCARVDAFHFTAVNPGEDTKLSALFDALWRAGITAITKLRRVFIRTTDTGHEMTVREGDMDVEITIKVMDLFVATGSHNHLVLFSGDGHFIPLVRRIQSNRVREKDVVVTVVSEPACLSRELEATANHVVLVRDLADTLENFTRDRKASTERS